MKFLKAKHEIGPLIRQIFVLASRKCAASPLQRFRLERRLYMYEIFITALFLRRIFPSAAFVCLLVGEIALLPQKNTRRRVTNKQTSASTALWVFFFITLNVVVYM
jgi:hypothetical protein